MPLKAQRVSRAGSLRKPIIHRSSLKDSSPPFLLGIEPTDAVITQKAKATMALTKMLPLTFEIEALPFDIIVKILHCFSSFEDLHSLTTASPICFRLFDSFAKSISMRVAKNEIGMGAWGEATTVLIYQRDDARMNTDPNNFDILKKELQSDFILHKTDIARIVVNQQFFNSCAADFKAYVSLNYPRPQPSNGSGGGGQDADTIDAPALSSASDSSVTWVLPPPSFTAGDTLPIKLFYQMWLLALQFGYESVGTFSNHPSLSHQQAADLLVVSKVMSQNRYSKLVVVSPRRMSDGKWEGAILNNLFQILGIVRWQPLPQRVYGRDYLFLLKMLSHLAAMVRGEGITVNPQFSVQLRALLVDYPVMGVAAMVEKYRLVGGWE